MTDDAMTKSNSHDPLCNALSFDGPRAEWCRCELIAEVVKRERLIYQETWATNLPLVCDREYKRGLKDGAK